MTPIVTVTAYAVSCLPEGTPDRRHWTLTVRRIGEFWTIEQSGEFLTAAGDLVLTPVVYDSVEHALAVAQQYAHTLVVNGITVEQALARGGAR